jgi:hypothetical protein
VDAPTPAPRDNERQQVQEIIDKEMPGWIIVEPPDLPQPRATDTSPPPFEDLRRRYAAWQAGDSAAGAPQDAPSDSAGTPAAAARDIVAYFVTPAKAARFLPRAVVVSLSEKRIIGLAS